MHGFADTWDVIRRAYLEQPYSPDHVDRAATALLLTRTTLHQRVGRALRDVRLRDVALLATRLDGHDPRQVPAWAGMWSYVEQNFGVWTVPGGMGVLAATMTKRLGERRVTVRLGTTARDLRLHGGRVVGVDTDHGTVDADVVVCAVDPRSLPVLAPHVGRSRPAVPPDVCHLGLVGDPPDLPHELVLHGAGTTLVVRTTGTAPAGGAAWTVLRRGDRPEDVLVTLARHGIDVRAQVRVRVDRTARDQVEELGGSPYGVLWQGRRTTVRKLAGLPVEGVYAAGVHGAAGSGLPLVGLAAAVVAQRVGPA